MFLNILQSGMDNPAWEITEAIVIDLFFTLFDYLLQIIMTSVFQLVDGVLNSTTFGNVPGIMLAGVFLLTALLVLKKNGMW